MAAEDTHSDSDNGNRDPAAAPPAFPVAEASPSAGAEVPDAAMISLDPRVVSYWRVNSLIGSLILLGLAAVGGMVLVYNLPHWKTLTLAGWGLLLLFRLWMLWWHPRRMYQAWGYRISDEVIEIRQGIFFRTVTLLPLSRLQHVDLHRGPLERSFGLASLILFTAGTQHAAIPLPGLEAQTAAQLRDRLVAAGGDDAV